MAFVSRSERDTSVPAPRSTTDKVGPGSYSLLPTRKFNPSAAPFASNTQRALIASTSSSTQHLKNNNASSPSSTTSSLAACRSGERGAAGSDASCRPASDPYRSTKSSSFASSTQRFTASKEALAKPGPGAYQTAPKWSSRHDAAQLHREAASKKVSELLGPAAGSSSSVALAAVQSVVKSGSGGSKAAEVPVLTPPSIPARHQSYGYEQGPGGLLVMQPPPQPDGYADGYADETAVASCNRPATCPDSAPSAAKGTAWAASRTDRWAPQKQHNSRQQRHQQQQQQQQQQGPGPTTYHMDNSATRFRMSPDGRLVPCRTSGRDSFSAAGSAAFLSRVARPHQMEPDPDRSTPGPGAYLKQQQLQSQSAPQAAAAGFKPAHSSPQQLFGRGSGRECAIGGLPGVTQPPSAAPGPGAYDLSDTTSLARTARSSRANLPPGAAVAAHAAMAVAHLDQDAGQAAAAGFGSTCSRFGVASSSSPGPGEYTADQAASMAADAAKKAATSSRRGVFGSAAERLDSGSSSGPASPSAAPAVAAGGASSLLGPGAYEVDCGVATRVAAVAARLSPGFASSSQRFTPAAAPVAAPDYCSWDGQPHSLRGDAARLGPGAYVKLDDWSGKAAGQGSMLGSTGGVARPSYHSAPFGSEAPRSSPVLAAFTANKGVTPGPGSYSNAAVDMRQVFRPLTVPGYGAGFSTGSKRFGSSTSLSPGPGTYTEDVANSCSLVRPSYNVTLDC